MDTYIGKDIHRHTNTLTYIFTYTVGSAAEHNTGTSES